MLPSHRMIKSPLFFIYKKKNKLWRNNYDKFLCLFTCYMQKTMGGSREALSNATERRVIKISAGLMHEALEEQEAFSSKREESNT